MAAFTMTTVLLLGLLSAAAIGATRAVAGAPVPVSGTDDPSNDVADDESGEVAAGGKSKRGATSPPRTAKGVKSDRSGAGRDPRRAGGAVVPSDALDRSAGSSTDEEAP